MKRFLVAFFAVCLLFSVASAVEGTNRTVKVNKVISDEISESGEVDYFNFSISDPGSIQLKLDFDVEEEYILDLIDVKKGECIQSTSYSSEVNTTSGRCEKSAKKLRLLEGKYQVKVYQRYFKDTGEDYELRIVYNEEDSDRYEKESNNEAKTAMLIDYNKNITGNLQRDDDVDYYMVEVPTNGELYTSLKFDVDAIYNVEVFSVNKGSLKSLQYKTYEAKLNQNSDTYTDTSEKLRVPEGTYYFKISKHWNGYSSKDYVFCVKYEANRYGNYEVEYNNEPRYATEITANNHFTGNLSTGLDADYYKVSLWNANKMKIKMNVPQGASYNVSTYKELNGELSEIKWERFESKELAGLVEGSEQEITSGDYYFRVTSRNYSNSDYTFLVSTDFINNYDKTTIVLEINNPYMLVNNVTYPVDGNRGTAPTILNSRTMLPVRAIIEALGGTVTWVESARGININLDGKNVYLTLDSALAYVNGEQKWLDVAPTSINGRTMVPVKFVMDNLGGSVIWNATTGTVTITY